MSVEPSLHWLHTSDRSLEAAVQRLTPAEIHRATQIRDPQARERFFAGCRLARMAVSAATGVPAERVVISRQCPRCRVQHGRPRVAVRGSASHESRLLNDVDVSISHTGNWVVVAVHLNGRIGVDVETADRDLEIEAMKGLILHPDEVVNSPSVTSAQLLRAWVRKEALLKATGDGLRLPPAGIRISDGPTPTVVEWTERPSLPAHVTVRDLTAPVGLVGALASLTPEGSSWMHLATNGTPG
ncbi:4'-phosphopantetheinyl transferase Sfp [soil metagenome]